MTKEAKTSQSIPELRAAAAQASAAYDWETALRLYTQALERAGVPPETEYDLRSGRAACHEGRGTYAAALPDLETMAHLAGDLDDAPRRITALNRQAEVCRYTGALAEGQRLAETALDLARQVTDPAEVGQRLEVDSLVRWGRDCGRAGQPGVNGFGSGMTAFSLYANYGQQNELLKSP